MNSSAVVICVFLVVTGQVYAIPLLLLFTAVAGFIRKYC
ncbi:hypothetical protein BN2127_JRS10_01202 [Bacillus subtilis]|nr:hypothetical protein BN2127_JRS10_01202 [Bacillus subtilis]